MSGDAAPFADAIDALAGPDPAAPPTPTPAPQPAPAPAPQPADPFADAKAALATAPDPTPQPAPADAREQQLRTSVSQAQDQDPDAAAKLQQTSAQANVPVGAADQAMVDKINATKAVDYPQLIHDNPGVAQWLSDPKNAAVAHDDIPNLQHVDLAVRLLAKAAQPQGAPSVIGQDPEDDKEALPIMTGVIGYGLHQAINEAGSTMLAIPALIQGAYRSVTGQDNPENFNFKEPGDNTPEGMIWGAQQLITQQEQARASYRSNVAKDVLTGVAGLPVQLPSMVGTPTAVAEHLAGQLPLVASSAMRAMAALKSMIAIQATQSGGEGLEQSAIARQKAGGGASIEPSDVANAVGQAALATVVGRAQGLVGPFAHFRGDPLTLGDIPRDLIANAMGTGTQAAGSQVIQSATAGNGLPQPGDIAKSYLSGAVMGTLLALPNIPGAAALSKAHDLVQQTMLAQQARDNAVVLAQNHVASKLSATAQRAPDAMQALVANVIKHTGQPDTGRVLFQAEDWDEHWIHAGGGSKDLPRDMVTALTGDPNAYDMAKATGPGGNGTISVPLDAYQARISGTDHGAALLDKARLQPHGMTLVEANKFFKDAPQTLSSIGDEMKAEIAKQAASADPNGDAVRLQIAHDAVQAGQDPVNSDAVARIHQDFHQGMANAMNEGRAEGEPRLTAADMAKAAPLDIRYAAPQAIPGRSVDAMDRDINNIRAGKVHSNEAIFGKTLGDFLREHGGVRDDGGELKQMEVDANRGFRKKLSNPKGMLPDDAAQLAHDAGYLPERSIDSMLRAIDEEQHGKPTYTHSNLNHDALANADHLKELHQFLKSIGADPVDEKDNAVIKTKIAEAEKDVPEAGRRFSQAAYHGTGNRDPYEKFDMGKVGGAGGEGAQAYGHGLYFTGKKAVAEHYRNKLSTRGQTLSIGGKTIKEHALAQGISELAAHNAGSILGQNDGDLHTAIDIAEYDLKMDAGKPKYVAMNEEILKYLRSLKQSDIQKSKGKLYHVDIPESHELLDQNKTLGDQSDHVKAALRKLAEKLPDETPKDYPQTGREWFLHMLDNQASTASGADFYYKLSKALAYHSGSMADGNDRLASQALRDSGVPGMTYKGLESSAQNYVMFDDSRIAIKSYEQSVGSGGGKIVRGTFQPVGRGGILTFTPNANLSTFLHESAHYFFHVLSHLASQPGAPARLVKDHQAILDWLGVKDVKDLTDEHQEDIAKAMENYFMRGQAPKVELRGVFQRFKAWMKHVYGAIGPSTRNAISPEVHAVFDRMFASDAEIAAAQSRAGDSHALPRDDALFPVGPEGDADYERYRAAVDASQERAESNLRSELMRAYQQEATAKWNDERMDVHEKVANEINSRPVYNMIHMLQDGRMADGTRLPDDMQGLKLNQKELEKLYDPESLRALPGPARERDKDGNQVAKANRGRPLYSKDGTLTLNDLAEQFGFSSGDEVFQALTGAPDRRTLIESETDARMREAHPDPLTDGSITTKADAALENEQKGKLLTMEVNALARAVNRSKKTGERDLVPSPLQVLRMAAEREVGNVPVGQLRPDLHRANEARAAKKAFEAAATGDHATAYHAKQSQMLNHELAVATEKAKVYATKIAEHARDLLRPAAQQRLGKAGGWEWTVTDRQGQNRTRFPTEAEAEAASKADPGSTFERTSSYVDQINGLLHTYEFANVSAKVLKRRADMDAFIRQQHDLDMPVDIPIEVQKQTTRINWKTLTVDQLGAMNDALRNIEAMAKLKNTFMDAQREGDLQDSVAHLKNSILSSNKTRVLAPRGDSSFASITNRAGRIVNAYSRATDLCFRMDGHETGGAFFDEWERPFQDSADARYRDTQDAVEHGNAMTDEWFKTADRGAFNRNLHKPQFFPTVKRSFTRLEVIRMAADYGSSGNRERLLANNKWTPEQAQSVFDSMPKADITYLNAKIKQVNSYWPRIAALEQRTKGVAPKKVDGLPFQCANGNVEGGYFRVIYDRVRNPGLMQKTGDEAAEAMMRGMGAGSAYTQHGHTIERTGNAGVPLSTDFGDFDRHIANVIHDLTHREVLIDAGRLLKRIAPTMTLHYGDGVVPQFESQLRAIAAGGTQNTTIVDPLLGYLRQNTIAANRAFNVATSVRQLAGMPFVAARFGYLPAIRAVGNMLDPASVLYAHMNSPTLVRRNQERGRELNEVANRTGTFAFMHPLNASRYLFLNYAWKMLDTHGWFAAYHEAKGRFPDDEAKCMSIADGQLAATQGAVDLKDHSEIMRQGGELGKVFTSNMSWANANFSLMQLSMYKYLDKNGSWKLNNPKQMAQAIGAMSTLLVVAPAIYMAAGQLMTQSDMSDWKKPAIVKDLAGEAAYTALSSVPLGRDLAPIFENQGGGAYQGPQGAAFLGTLAKAGYEAMSAVHGQSERRRSTGVSPGEKAALDLSGIIFPIPSTQIEHMVAGYIAAQHQGEGAVGTTAATIFGPPDKQKRRLNQ